jgi:hypothetical protein
MKNIVKTFRVVALIIAILGAQVAHPPRANAAAGIGLAVAGGGGIALMVAGGVTVALGLGMSSESMNDAMGQILFFLGFLLLDKEDGEIIFGSISESDSQKLGVSQDQINSYNQELDKINLIREQIQSELYTAVQNGEKVDFSTAHEKWEQYKAHISPAAYAVLEKISANVVENL